MDDARVAKMVGVDDFGRLAPKARTTSARSPCTQFSDIEKIAISTPPPLSLRSLWTCDISRATHPSRRCRASTPPTRLVVAVDEVRRLANERQKTSTFRRRLSAFMTLSARLRRRSCSLFARESVAPFLTAGAQSFERVLGRVDSCASRVFRRNARLAHGRARTPRVTVVGVARAAAASSRSCVVYAHVALVRSVSRVARVQRSRASKLVARAAPRMDGGELASARVTRPPCNRCAARRRSSTDARRHSAVFVVLLLGATRRRGRCDGAARVVGAWTAALLLHSPRRSAVDVHVVQLARARRLTRAGDAACTCSLRLGVVAADVDSAARDAVGGGAAESTGSRSSRRSVVAVRCATRRVALSPMSAVDAVHCLCASSSRHVHLCAVLLDRVPHE